MKFGVILAGTLALAGCAAPHLAGQGSNVVGVESQSVQPGVIELHIKWPSLAPRRVAEIPTDTTKLVVTISASDISPSIVSTIQRPSGASSTTAQINVPPGSERIVQVAAQDSGSIELASGLAENVSVTAGQFTPVTVNLSSEVGQVSGQILEGDTNLPISGATVAIANTTRSATTDSNGNFTIVDVPSGSQQLTVSMAGYIAGTSVKVSVSADNTASVNSIDLTPIHWVQQLTGVSANLNRIYFVDANNGWAVGNSGTILHTTDGGSDWNSETSGITDNLADVYFLDDLHGWAVGGASVLKTTDGGLNWKVVTSTGLSSAASSVFPLSDGNTVLFGGQGALISVGYSIDLFSSSNDGSSWAATNPLDWTYNYRDTINDIYFVSATRGWLAAEVNNYGSNAGPAIAFTNDGGTNWSPQTLPNGIGSSIVDIGFTSSTMGWAASSNGSILNTSDGGATWAIFGATGGGGSLTQFRFLTSTIGYGVGSGGPIYITKDGGKTFSTEGLSNGKTTQLNSITAVSTSSIWVAGNNGEIYKY